MEKNLKIATGRQQANIKNQVEMGSEMSSKSSIESSCKSLGKNGMNSSSDICLNNVYKYSIGNGLKMIGVIFSGISYVFSVISSFLAENFPKKASIIFAETT